MTTQDTKPRAQLVVIGASAGGIAALSSVLGALPADFAAPVVVAQHLDPHRSSKLGKILAGRVHLPVRTVTAKEALTPGVVYVVPPDMDVEIIDHTVRVRRHDGRGPTPSIDRLLATASRVYAHDLVAVILTGSGTDGAEGVQAVKALGGTVIVQNPATAAYSGMPGSVAPSAVDVVAEIEAIGPLLVQLLSDTYDLIAAGEEKELHALLELVREHGGVDFASYKRPTIARRLQRGMATLGIPSLAAYHRHLETHPEEIRRLAASFLIKVTGFFRDPEYFDHLRKRILPELLGGARKRGELRLWSAGCATGEEAYSLAMLVADLVGDELGALPVRIFATDIATGAIDFGRRGVYQEDALTGMPPELAERYFVQLDGHWEVRNEIRGLIVFGEHDLGSRSPFPRIDLILCRNVLIYFTPELQRRALQLFAFSLRSGGYLALGKAETVSPLPKYFAVEQPHLKIYRRINTPSPMPVPSALDTGHAARIPSPLSNRQAVGGQLVAQSVSPRVEETAQSQRAALLLESIPLGIITVSSHYDIRSLNIAARTLLNLHSASAGDDLIHRLPPAVAQPLRAALDATFHGELQTLRLRCDDDVLESGGRNLEILCYPPADSALVDASAILVISDVTVSAQHDAGSDAEREQLRAGLERETTRATRMAAELGDLRRANTTMATNLAQLRADNELLRVAHEEDQAAAEEIETLNEEAQATNEELETLNEEARATVEELSTANDELQARGFELRTLATAREMERARWEAVLSGIGDAVLVVDENERLLQTNDAFREMFGPDLPFAPKDEDGNVLPANARPQARAARGEGFETTFSLTGPDGARRWYEAKGQPIRPGEPGGVVAIRDITDRSLRRLQDQWLAIASHELRTPLTTLQVLLQLAQRRREDDERMGPLLDQAREQVRRLGALITVLVDAERLRGDGLHFIRQRVDLGALVDGAVETARHLARGQTIALTKPTTPFWVDGDGNRLEQVLLNLLTNAITYAPGTSQIEVRLQRKGADAMIEVRDYGPGIPAADLERIFARYHHVDQGVTNGFAGLGLGLFIAREIVVAHGGVIDARSTMGEGAVFTICLPLARDEIANPAPVRVAKPARGKSKSPAG